jgi:peptidyl-dipeptidase Dcp
MNPLFEEFDTPYGVPAFDKIKTSHYLPAFEEAMIQQKAEVEAIAYNNEAPTFANTVEELDATGSMLNRVSNIFFNLTSAHTNEELNNISEKIAPILSLHNDFIYMNEKLFARFQSIWRNRDILELDEEQNQLLEKFYKTFTRNGAMLSAEQKAKLSEINQEISLLTVKFGQNNLSEVNEYKLIVDDKSRLAGLPDELLYAAAVEANNNSMEGKWIFTLQNPSVMPFLQYAQNRELRKEIWEAFRNKGNNNNRNDNKEIIAKLVNLRQQKANMLGYQSYSHYSLEEQMSKTPDKAYKLLNELWTPALKVAKNEAADLQKRMQADGITDKLMPYDWRYYAELIRKEKYDLDEQELKPYFSLDGVRNGIFTLTNKLWGLSFKKLNNVPTYHEDVTAWQVLESNGNHVGVLYMDFHPRASKRGGAWMTSFSDQQMKNGMRIAPVISIVCNFSTPTADAPALLTFDEVETFFHEFGHALHGLLSNVRYNSLAGTSVPTDFVELPSQIMENWAAEPQMLQMYANHYNTGEVIPDALIAKMQRSNKYGQGFATVEYLAASFLDLAYHTQTTSFDGDVLAFEQNAAKQMKLIDEIIPRYRSTYFNHIFAGGYASRYYSYIWSGVLDTDAFEAFKETSLFDANTAQSFRKNVLEKGGSADPLVLYKRFRGREPVTHPLLRKRGLLN